MKLKVLVFTISLMLFLTPGVFAQCSLDDTGAFARVLPSGYTYWEFSIHYNDGHYASWNTEAPGKIASAYTDCDCEQHDSRMLPVTDGCYFSGTIYYTPCEFWLNWALYGEDQSLVACSSGNCEQDGKAEVILHDVYVMTYAVSFIA